MYKSLQKTSALVILLFDFAFSISQTLELSNFKIEDQYEKNCGVIKNCIDSIRFSNRSLIFNLYIEDASEYMPERTLSYKLSNDTLLLNYYSEAKEKDTVIFNKVTGKYDSLKYYSQVISNGPFSHSCKTFLFEFIGLTKTPGYFTYNKEVLQSCPVTYVSYSIYKGDTINIINAKGNKEGRWMNFYDTGEILKVKNYKNGRFTSGNIFDKAGKITHIVDEEEEEVAIPVELYNQMHK